MGMNNIQPISFPSDFGKLTELREKIEKEMVEWFRVSMGLFRERKKGYTANIVRLMQLEFYSELVRGLSNCKFPTVNFIPK